uniref:Uncharacterized protein n=1 Tax=viral metagenome TaxID=1070528 RepID=A0A6C0K0T4_9ZZZZ
MAEEHIIQDHDLVFNKSGGKIQSAGFTVESILLQKGEPALITRNLGLQRGGGSVADLFKDLAVPAGLVSFTRKQFGGESRIQNDDTVIGDDVYEKLLKMVEVEGGAKKQRKTRRANGKTNGKTKKQKLTV